MIKVKFDELPNALKNIIRHECMVAYRKLPEYVMITTKVVGGVISVSTYDYE